MAMDPRDVRGMEGRPVEGTNVYETHEKEITEEVLAGGSAVEALGGAGAVVLAIIGLANAWPGYMAAIATIVVGGALLFQGMSIAARYSDLARRTGATEISGSMSMEVLGGAAGVTLGILALMGIFPATLTAVAIIVLGGSLVIGSAATARFNDLTAPTMSHRARLVTRAGVELAAGTDVLIGLGAAVLGILALLSLVPRVLVLVGLLALGGAIFVSASAITTRMITLFRSTS